MPKERLWKCIGQAPVQFVHRYIFSWGVGVGHFSLNKKYPQTLQLGSLQLCTLNIILSSSVWSKSGRGGGVGEGGEAGIIRVVGLLFVLGMVGVGDVGVVGEVVVVLRLVFVVGMVGVVGLLDVVGVVGIEVVGESGLWVG